MTKRTILYDVQRGVQRTLTQSLEAEKKKVIQIEITPNVQIHTNRFSTAHGLMIERIIKVLQDPREKEIMVVV